jgi:hypothetical protein
VVALLVDGRRPTGAAYAPAADQWRRLPPAPLAHRSDHAAVWTGNDMLVWGGVQPGRGGRSEVAVADGAAYRPTTRTWRPVPPAPLAGDTAVWSGTELLVFGRAEGGAESRLDAAAWDPRGERWRRLAASPLPAGNEFSADGRCSLHPRVRQLCLDRRRAAHLGRLHRPGLQ